MIQKSSTTITIDIYMAGDIRKASDLCQEFCDALGFCINISQTNYIYTNGSQQGFRVGLINYPRFPSDEDTLMNTAIELGDYLRAGLDEQSYSIVSSSGETVFRSWRDDLTSKETI